MYKTVLFGFEDCSMIVFYHSDCKNKV